MRVGKGLTLVELLLVVAVVAVLAAVTVPRVLDYRNEAKKARCNANIASLESVIELYVFEKGSYPRKIKHILIDEYFPHGKPNCPFRKKYRLKAGGKIRPHKHK